MFYEFPQVILKIIQHIWEHLKIRMAVPTTHEKGNYTDN